MSSTSTSGGEGQVPSSNRAPQLSTHTFWPIVELVLEGRIKVMASTQAKKVSFILLAHLQIRVTKGEVTKAELVRAIGLTTWNSKTEELLIRGLVEFLNYPVKVAGRVYPTELQIIEQALNGLKGSLSEVEANRHLNVMLLNLILAHRIQGKTSALAERIVPFLEQELRIGGAGCFAKLAIAKGLENVMGEAKIRNVLQELCSLAESLR